MIEFMAVPHQKVWKINDNSILPPSSAVFTCDGMHEIRRKLVSGSAEYIVCSVRNGIVWDLPLINRVEHEISAIERAGINWLCLTADGVTLGGQHLAAAFFDREPTLVPDRGRRCVVQSAGTIYVINVKNFRKLGLKSLANDDFVKFMNHLIILGYSERMCTIYTDQLYPCFAEHRDLCYQDLDVTLASVNETVFHPRPQIDFHTEHSADRTSLLRSWVEEAERALVTPHIISFVVRSIFKRPFMLRRCLISIDYLRRSIECPVEVVIATDVSETVYKSEIAKLSSEFPGLLFVVADGNSEPGYSRVRNLIAGIKATSGSRVCIIDDDDFYTTDAIAAFTVACKSPCEQLVLFDTQIVVEKWTLNGGKTERELLSYGGRYPAKDWMYTLRGSNSIPLCGVIHPGKFARQVAAEYDFKYDFSEDFIFHLMAFAHHKRPPVVLVETLGAFQSHRVGDDNVSTVEDRTPWVADVGNGIHQLLIERGYNFDAICGNEAFNGAIGERESIELLSSELERTREALVQSTRMLAQATVQLRRAGRAALSTAAPVL